MDSTATNIVLSIVGTAFSVIGALFVFVFKKALADIQTIKLDCEILKRDIKYAIAIKEAVDADHDKLVRIESEFSSHREQDAKEKKAFFDKAREHHTRFERIEARLKSNHR